MENTKKFFALTMIFIMLFSVAPVLAITSTDNDLGNSTNQTDPIPNTTVTPTAPVNITPPTNPVPNTTVTPTAPVNITPPNVTVTNTTVTPAAPVNITPPNVIVPNTTVTPRGQEHTINQNNTITNLTVTTHVTGNSINQNRTVTTTTVTNNVAGNSTNNIYKPTVNVTPNITPTTHQNAPVFAHTVANSGFGKSSNGNGMVALPTANFTANVTYGKAPLSVLFTSNCTGNPTEFNWTYGDGVYSNNNWTAIHTYTQAGKYNVSLTVSNATGNNTTTKLEYINVSKAAVVNYRILCTGKAPWKVSFKDNNRKHITSFWNLGDGTTTSSKKITHIYKNPGKYPITLKYETAGHVKHTLHAGYIVVTGSSPSSTPAQALTPTPTPTSTKSSDLVYISAFYVGASNQTKDQEYVQIKNTGTTAVNLNGWTIADEGAKHVYTFSSYTLPAKSMVTLISGFGANTSSTLYWNKDIFIWNNDGDTAYLYDAQGKLVFSKSG